MSEFPKKIYFPPTCTINPILSRSCNLGTKSCQKEHIEYIRTDIAQGEFFKQQKMRLDALKPIREVYEKYKNGVKQEETKYWIKEMSLAIDKTMKGKDL